MPETTRTAPRTAPLTAPLAAAVAAAALLVAPSAQAAGGDEREKLTVITDSEEYGPYIADADGRALYMFTEDVQGDGSEKAVSDCYDRCTVQWPPYTLEGETLADSEGIEKSLVQYITRKDGARQVTYGGWPLYYFEPDDGDEPQGHDDHGFGGEWYLLAPDGTKAEEQ